MFRRDSLQNSPSQKAHDSIIRRNSQEFQESVNPSDDFLLNSKHIDFSDIDPDSIVFEPYISSSSSTMSENENLDEEIVSVYFILYNSLLD